MKLSEKMHRLFHHSFTRAAVVCLAALLLTLLCTNGLHNVFPDDSELYRSSRAVTVNINEATVSELTALDGIGIKRAEDIVQYRRTHGAFQNAADITNVPGIGEGIYRRIRNQIRV